MYKQEPKKRRIVPQSIDASQVAQPSGIGSNSGYSLSAVTDDGEDPVVALKSSVGLQCSEIDIANTMAEAGYDADGCCIVDLCKECSGLNVRVIDICTCGCSEYDLDVDADANCDEEKSE